MKGKILVINCGSSSVKYHVYDVEKDAFLAQGIVEKVGERGSFIKHTAGGKEVTADVAAPNHEEAIKIVRKYVLDPKTGVVKDEKEIIGVGHRVVHGGRLSGSVRIDQNVIRMVREYIPLAPLHNPPNLAGIAAMRKMLPKAPQVAVFDTAFHQSLPEKAYRYALPSEFLEKYGIRRYGFHGTSHQYVSRAAALFLKRPYESLKMITCHLGAGSSMTAIKNGKSVDTSMGFTPLEGLVMGTRTGDMDPAIIFYLVDQGLKLKDVYEILNERSGLLGMSGKSKDMREILSCSTHSCKIAFDLFCYRVKKYIGSYAAALGGLDALVFTAGIGENQPEVRAAVCDGLEFLGVRIDAKKNADNQKDISAKGSKVKVLVIPTNEAKLIAIETLSVVKG